MGHKMFTNEQLDNDYNAVQSAMRDESPLKCALVGAAFVEKRLGNLLRAAFVDDASVLERLFGPRGVVETSGAQNDIAMALGLISESIHWNIVRIQKIRNRFAHTHLEMDFSDDEIRSHCNTFRFPHVIATVYVNTKIFRTHLFSDPRERFALVASIISTCLGELASKTPRGHVSHLASTWFEDAATHKKGGSLRPGMDDFPDEPQ